MPGPGDFAPKGVVRDAAPSYATSPGPPIAQEWPCTALLSAFVWFYRHAAGDARMDFLELFQTETDLVWKAAGDVIFSEGEIAREMYVIMHGTVDVVVGGNVVESAGPGMLFGEMALIGRTERSATVYARTDCRLVSLDVTQFDQLIQKRPRFAREVMQIMAERLRRLSTQFTETHPTPARVQSID